MWSQARKKFKYPYPRGQQDNSNVLPPGQSDRSNPRPCCMTMSFFVVGRTRPRSMLLAMLTVKKAMHACMWFCSYSYGALVDSSLGRRSSAIKSAILNNEALPKTFTGKEIVVNNKHKLRFSFFFQMVYHKCYYCNKRFLPPSHRDRHIMTHTGEKPFPCQECGKRFSRRFSLTRHAQTHATSKYLFIIWH